MYGTFQDLIEELRGEEIPIAVAAAHDKDVLLAVKEAMTYGLIIPHLVGRKQDILKLCEDINLSIDDKYIYDIYSEEECALYAAKLADQGVCEILMKGMVNSTPFLKGVLNRNLSLKNGHLLSHLSAFDIPLRDQVIFMTDGGLNIAPNVSQKVAIIKNAVEFLRDIGIDMPNVALLAANERTSDNMPFTVECQEVIHEIEKSSWANKLIIEGPLPLDLAISKESLAHKKIKSRINGEADLLVVPNIEAGNILGKAITYFAQGTMAGIVLGAKVPLVLNSRSDSVAAKVASTALAIRALKSRIQQD